jgi:UDP-glucose 4-epimerase
VVPSLIRLVGADSACGRAVNLGSTEQVSIEGLAQRVIEATGSASTIRTSSYQEAYGAGYEDMLRRVPDCTLAGDLVGFRARRSLDEIIESVISDQVMSAPAVAAAVS